MKDQSAQESYGYKESASNEMLIKLLITCDGRGSIEKRLALKKLLERYQVSKEEVDEIIGG